MNILNLYLYPDKFLIECDSEFVCHAGNEVYNQTKLVV